MIASIIGFWVILFLLTLIGFGPGLYLIRGVERRVLMALAIAPVLALALIDIVGFPLTMYVAPAASWAIPITGALVLFSVSLAVNDFHKRRQDYKDLPVRKIALWGGLFILVCIVLLSPMFLLGIQYALFRSNPSDAFFYMSFAESMRVVEWDMLVRGASFSQGNIDNLNALAEVSPTALLTARFTARPTSVNHLTTLAWFSELAVVPIYQFYYAFHLLILAVTFPIMAAIGRLLKLRPLFVALAAGAIILGFWPKLVIEMDSSYEMGAMPLLALVVFALILMEGDLVGDSWRVPALLAIAVSAIFVLYFPPLLVFVVAVLLLASFHLLRVRDIRQWLGKYLLAAVFVLAIIILSGQFLYHFREVFVSLNVLDDQKVFTPTTFQILVTDKFAALIDLPLATILNGIFTPIVRVFRYILQIVGIVFVSFWVLAFVTSLRDKKMSAQRAVLAMSLAGGMLFVWLWFDGNPKASGKAFTYVYPYTLFTFLVGIRLALGRLTGLPRKGLMVLTTGWLIVVLVAGAAMPYNSYAASRFKGARLLKSSHSYDLAPILTKLEEDPPDLILVNTPKVDTWYFPYAIMQALSDYPTHYQNGLVMDNDIQYQNFLGQTLQTLPDYVLISRNADYLEGTGRGEVVAQTQDLLLYRISSTDLTFFQAQETFSRATEANKYEFPSWAQ